jgi:negative regulator of sigma E activity
MTRLGATHTLAQPGGDDHWLTLMGDVPLPTLQAIAGVLQRRP